MGMLSVSQPAQHPDPSAGIMDSTGNSTDAASQQAGCGSQHATVSWQGAGASQHVVGAGMQAGGVPQPCIRLISQPAEAGLIVTKVARVTTRVHCRARRIERFIVISGGFAKGKVKGRLFVDCKAS